MLISNSLKNYILNTLFVMVARKRILIVDDEPDIAAILKAGLQRSGFDVETFTSPQDALSKFIPFRYDLALIDFKMPGMNGIELYQKIRRLDEKIEACFITAFETDAIRQFADQLAEPVAKCVIKKPMSIQYLVETINRKFNQIR